MLTILFFDQVESTSLLAAVGDEAMVAIRSDLWSLFTRVVADYSGQLLSDEGDGGAAVFEQPENALQAGLTLLAATRARDDLVLRAGCNTGKVLPTANGMVGLAIHLAARVCDVAPARHLVATDSTTAALSGSDFGLRFTNFGRRNMKGLALPVALNLVTRSSDPLPTPELVYQLRSSPLLDVAFDAADFVGRGEETDALHRALYPPEADRASIVLLAGDPGSGKTALAYHVARQLSAAGVLCLVGRSDEALNDPFFEMIEMLRPLVRSLPMDDLLRHTHLFGTVIARLFPELAERIDAEQPGDENAAPDRQHLFAAVGDLLATVATRQPVMLLLEDLHWVSAQSLDLLRHLLRAGSLRGVSVLVTFRARDSDGSESVSTFLQWLTREYQPLRIDLPPLGFSEIAGLCRSLLGELDADVRDKLARHLASQTGGNALFCTEMLRSLRDNTSLLTPAIEVANEDIGRLVQVPSTVQKLALARVRKLGAVATEVLTDAAVLGESFDLIELQAMSAHDAFAALDVAERAGIVRPAAADGTQFTFGHALVQRALYEQQAKTMRWRRHRAAADALAARSNGGYEELVFDRLHHLRTCGPLARHEEVATAASTAAAAATGKLALAEGMQLRQLAVDELLAGGADRRAIAVALAQLGQAQTANALQVGKSTMVAAAAEAGAAADWDLLADIAIAYGGELKENQAATDVSEPVALISDALESHQQPTTRRARLLSALAVWQRQHRPYAERLAAVDEALDIARRQGDPRTLGKILSERHRALHGPNAAPEALGTATELELIAADLGSDELAFQAMYLRVIAALELGQWNTARQNSPRLISLGARLQSVEGRRLHAMWNNLNAQIQGDWDASRQHVGEVMKIVSDYPPADAARLAGAMSFIGVWFEHGPVRLHKLLRHGAGRVSTSVWCAAEAGEEKEAMRLLLQAPTVAELATSLDYMWWHDVVCLTRAASALGLQTLASELYEIMHPYRNSNAMMGFAAFLGAAEHHLGTLAATLGRVDTAREHFAKASARHEAMGAIPFLKLTGSEAAALG